VDPLAAAGVPVWIDRDARVAHAKAMVIDGALTLMGWMHWTCGAAANADGLNLVLSSEVEAAYAAHWRQRLTMSVSFGRREDWCRV
jgi:hypothetical protein